MQFEQCDQSPNLEEEKYRYARVGWACRRGMRELDLLLQPFLERIFPTLGEQEKRLFEELLRTSDQELYAWFIGKEQPTNQEFIEIIKQIHKCAKHPI